MPTSSHRTLLQALAVSLVLHALVLCREVKRLALQLDAPPRAISAVIRPGSRELSATPIGAPASKAPSPPVKIATPDRHRQIALRSPVSTESTTAQVNSSRRESAATTASPPAVEVAATAAVAGTPLPTGTPGVASGEGRQGVSADDLRHYRLSLATAARRFKSYPPLASQRGWEGTVEVALNVRALAPVPEVVLVRSSGRRVLDEQALEMLTRAARVTTLPEGLKARDFRILLPVEFSLDNDQ